MSGPKGGTWHLVPAGQGISFDETKAVLREYLYYIMQYSKQLEILLQREPALHINTWVDELSMSDPDCGQKLCDELNNRYKIKIRLHDEVEEAKATFAMRERAAALVDSLRRSGPSIEEMAANQRRAFNDRVQGLLNILDVRAAKELLEEIESLAKFCLTAEDPVRAELLVTDLRVRINRLNRTIRDEQQRLAEQRDKDAAEARECIQRLGVLGHSFEETFRDDLLHVASGNAPFTDELRKRVAAAIAGAEKAYAGSVLKEALLQLGYEVQGGFETLFAQGGSNFFQRPSWSEYHCRITVDPQRQHLNFDMVRYGVGSEETMDVALQDKEMEQKWCKEVPGLLGRLAEKGLAVDLTRKLAPGTIALQVIDDDRLKPVYKERERETLSALERHF